MLFECKYCYRISNSEIEEVNNETNRYFLVTVRCEYCAKLQRHKKYKPRKKTDDAPKQNQVPKEKEEKNETSKI